MKPAPIRCPACGTVAVPVLRLFGYPTPEGLALLDAGDAEIATGCVTDGEDEGREAPCRCRRCRRHLVPSKELAITHAEIACDGDARHLGDGLFVDASGRLRALVLPVQPPGTLRFHVAPEARQRLLEAREPVVVLRAAGEAARFVVGPAARRALASDGTLTVPEGAGLTVEGSGSRVACRLRPPRRR